MTTVLLVRHGRTSANTAGVLAGRTAGVRLDDAGRQQAEEVGRRLSGLPVSAVVTSPLERCRQTSRAILTHLPAAPATPEMITERGLIEVDYGEWTGAELKTLAKDPLWQVVQTHPAGVRFPGGESLAQMAARAVAAVRRWDAQFERDQGADAIWVAVSHGDVIKAVLADALGMHLDAFQRIMVDPASVSVIRYTPARPFVWTLNSLAGDLSVLRPPKRRGRRAATRDSDAAVGGGAGPGGR